MENIFNTNELTEKSVVSKMEITASDEKTYVAKHYNESVHRQFRKLTKTKDTFPSENSLMKLLYMGIQNASKKWTMPVWNWSLTVSQPAIFFEGRLDKYPEV